MTRQFTPFFKSFRKAEPVELPCKLEGHTNLPTMLLVANMKAKPGESAESALERLLKEGDPDLESIAREHDPMKAECMRAAAATVDTPTSVEKSFLKVKATLEGELTEFAKSEARAGETTEGALVRLIDEHNPRAATLYDAINSI